MEHCGESAGAALRAGPLGRMSYHLVPAGRSAAGRETLYGKLLHAIGAEAALDLWTRLGAEDWLVRTVARCPCPCPCTCTSYKCILLSMFRFRRATQLTDV